MTNLCRKIDTVKKIFRPCFHVKEIKKKLKNQNFDTSCDNRKFR